MICASFFVDVFWAEQAACLGRDVLMCVSVLTSQQKVNPLKNCRMPKGNDMQAISMALAVLFSGRGSCRVAHNSMLR